MCRVRICIRYVCGRHCLQVTTRTNFKARLWWTVTNNGGGGADGSDVDGDDVSCAYWDGDCIRVI